MKMRIVEDWGDRVRMECECGCIFEADILTEENLMWQEDSENGCFVAVCPNCNNGGERV